MSALLVHDVLRGALAPLQHRVKDLPTMSGEAFEEVLFLAHALCRPKLAGLQEATLRLLDVPMEAEMLERAFRESAGIMEDMIDLLTRIQDDGERQSPGPSLLREVPAMIAEAEAARDELRGTLARLERSKPTQQENDRVLAIIEAKKKTGNKWVPEKEFWAKVIGPHKP